MLVIDANGLSEKLKQANPQTSKMKWADILARTAPAYETDQIIEEFKRRAEIAKQSATGLKEPAVWLAAAKLMDEMLKEGVKEK